MYLAGLSNVPVAFIFSTPSALVWTCISSAVIRSDPCLISAFPLNSLKPDASSTITDSASISMGCFASSESAKANVEKNIVVNKIILFINSYNLIH